MAHEVRQDIRNAPAKALQGHRLTKRNIHPALRLTKYCILLVALFLPALVSAQNGQGWIGVVIQNIPPTLSERFKLSNGKGALVIDVVKGQPADTAGIKRGDAIVEIAGGKVDSVLDLQQIISRQTVGNKVKVKIVREGEFRTFDVKIARAGRVPRSVRLGRNELLFWLVITAITIFFSYAYSLIRTLARRAGRARETAERPERRWPRVSWKSVIAVAGIFLVLAALFTSVKIIQPGHRGVVFNIFTGLQQEVLGEGVHVLAPFVNRVIVYDVRTHTYTIVKNPRIDKGLNETSLMWAPTVDGLKVGLEMTVRYKPDPLRLVELHGNVGPDYERKIVIPSLRNVARVVVSSYHISDVYFGQRLEIQQRIKDVLGGMLAADGIVLENVMVRDVIYSPEFENAIERKMVAEQKVKELSYLVEQEGKRARARVKEAEGEAQAFGKVSDQIRENPNILNYMWIREIRDGTPLLVIPPKK